MNTLKCGDVVTAVTGGLPMTVRSVDGETVECDWFAGNEFSGWELCRGKWLADSLVVRHPDGNVRSPAGMMSGTRLVGE